MNNICLIGRTTEDIELRTTSSNKSVCHLSLAVKRPFSKETDFINCVAWDATAEVLATYVHKGNQVAIAGYLTIRNYEDKQGNKRQIAEVIVTNVTLLSNEVKTSQDKLQSESQPFNPDDFAVLPDGEGCPF